MAWLWISSKGPKLIPDWAYDCLDPKTPLGNMLCVEQTTVRKGVALRLIRIFDPAAVPDGVQIEDFASLDQHPELILYEGCREEASGKVSIKRMEKP